MSMAHFVVTKRRTWWVRSRASIGIAIMAPFIFVALFSRPVVTEGSLGDMFFDFAGWVLFVAGGAFRWWATLYIGGRKHEAVVDEGAYSVCRNPLYLGTFLMGASVAVFFQSLTFAFGFACSAVFYLTVTIPAEESLLEEKFGQPFRDYCERVPRLIPNFRLLKFSPTVILNIGGVWSEALRCARWIWLPMICDFIAHFRSEEWWPHFWRLP